MKELETDKTVEPLPIQSKRITKKRKTIKAIKIKKDYESFYTGGELLLTRDSLIAALYDNTIKFYDMLENAVIFRIVHENEEISNFEYFYSKQGEFLLTFTKNGILRLLKLSKEEGKYNTVELKRKKFIKFFAVEMKIDQTKNYIVIADPKGEFRIVGLNDFKIIREFSLGMGYVKMKLINQYIIFLSKERAVVYYNIINNTVTRKVESEDKVAFSEFVVLHGTSKELLIAGFDGYLYKTSTKSQIKKVMELNGFVQSMESLRIPNENKTLVVIGYDDGKCQLVVYDQKSDECFSSGFYLEANKHGIGKVLFDFTNQVFYIITDESEIYQMKLKKGTNGFIMVNSAEINALNDEIMDLKFIDDENIIVCSNSETIRHTNTRTNKTSFIHAHNDLVTSCDTFNKQIMVTGSKDGKIYLWNTNKSDNSENYQINFSLIKKYKGHVGGVIGLNIGKKSGTVFVSAGADGFIKMWNLETKNCKSLKTQAKELNFVKLSPNEKYIIYGSHEKTLRVHSTKDMSLINSYAAHKRGIWDAEWAPMEKKIASGSSDMTIKIWDYTDINNIQLQKTLEGHTSAVLKLKWLLYGLQLLSGSAEGSIKLWNERKGICLATYNNNSGRIWALDVFETAENFYIASGDNDNKLLLWEDATDDIEMQKTHERQEHVALKEELELLWSNKKYDDAIKMSFEKNLYTSFFDSFQQYYKDYTNSTKLIYLQSEIGSSKAIKDPQNDFKNQIKNLVQELWSNDKSKLLKMLRSFITNRKYMYPVEFILQNILTICKINHIDQVRDELRGHELELFDILNIYKIFNDRNMNATVRDLKSVHAMNFKIRQNIESL